MSDYKLVPVEPTEEMLMACYHPQIKKAERAELYRTMLAAAPQVQQEPVAWMARFRGRFGRVDWTEWSPMLWDPRVDKETEWEAYPLFAHPQQGEKP